MSEEDEIDTWPMPVGEPFPDHALRAEGWVYRDLPRMSYEAFDLFLEIVGERNLNWLTFADYGTARRGQVLISPQGLERMSAHTEIKKGKEE